MVLTFTGTISVAEGGEADTRTVLAAAVACNLAWGIVDGAMYLLTTFAERARAVATLHAIRDTREQEAAHRLIRDALPPVVSSVLMPAEVETLRARLIERPASYGSASLTRSDFAGAAVVFLLVFLSTFPLVLPFLIVPDPASALRTSNAIAIVMLFITGWSLGRHAGRPGWRGGLNVVAIGVVLVAITMALGG